jgi:hypothetical protein
MKVSLIALYTCCAVSSAAFAYQNAPQSGQSAQLSALSTQGAQFVMRDDPGASPPKAAVMDDPGASPPKAAVMDDPGASPPKAAVMDDPGASPPKASVMAVSGVIPSHRY